MQIHKVIDELIR